MDFNGLRPGSKGDKVELLQKMLLAIGFAIDRDEITQSHFGVKTGKALSHFQEKNKLQATGSVNRDTAQVLGQAYQLLFNENGSNAKFTVKGRIVDEDDRILADVVVELWALIGQEKEISFNKSVTTDQRGLFAMEISFQENVQIIKEGVPRLFFKLFLGEKLIENTRNSVVLNPEVKKQELKIVVKSQLNDVRQWTLQGAIKDVSNASVSGLNVVAIDKKSELELGVQITDATGRFNIVFTNALFEPFDFPDDYLPDVFFQVLKAEKLLLDTNDQPLEDLVPGVHEVNLLVGETKGYHYHIVSGYVRRENGTSYSGALVRALHKDDRGLIRLGEDETDNDGLYTIRYDASPIEGVVNLFVTVQGSDGKSVGESDIKVNAETRETLNIAIPDREPQIYQVEGKVHSRSSAAIGGLRVVIVDKRVGGDVALAQTQTHESGSYHVTFKDKDLQCSGKDLPDLQARVFRGDKFLGASDVRYNVSTRETLNVLLDEKSTEALQSEIEILTGTLAKHFQGNLRDLKETDELQDISYLANKTGWDARAVALAALADRFGDSSAVNGNGIESPFFYALFRAGLPANEDSLYQTDSETVMGIWKQSIEKGVIPKTHEDRLPEAMEKFQGLAAKQTLEGPASIGVSPLKDMLTVSIGDNTQDQQKFAEIHTRFKNDLPRFWEEVRGAFGEDKENRLRLDGQLAYLTLNNAPLVQKLHAQAGRNGLANSVELVELGFHKTDKWKTVIGDIDVPKEIKGANIDEKRANYAEVQAAQIRLSFPTAVVAQMVKEGETPLLNGSIAPVHDFLMQHQGKFEIGRQPVEHYIRINNLQIDAEVAKEVTRIQRVYQITPSDDAMNVLLQKGVDSAFAVAGYGQESFINGFRDELGGEENAKLTYAKAQQVHNTVLNVVLNYQNARVAPSIGGANVNQLFLNPQPAGPDNADDIIAYPTLEGLFGEMDYCECEHCRSVLSPAAYMVDLLQFIDPEPGTFTGKNPLDVLLGRRPDLQHIPLTCENTNTPLPYIDLVKEVLEHYITNNLSLSGYRGHNTTDEATPAELLANPQFVSDRAYEVIADKPENPGDPSPLLPPVPHLPFHRSLENLRRYFNKFEAPLPKVMEALRENDVLARTTEEENYRWRDIWMEVIQLSRAEYARLTDRNISLKQVYGFPATTSDSDVLAELSNAKAYSLRIDISYVELIEILKTRFVNPQSTLIPRLERLGISFATIKAYKDGAISDEQLEEALSPHLDESKYDGDIKAWLKDDANFKNIMSLITLTDPESAEDVCSFDKLEFRYANPDNSSVHVRPFEFIRLIRFIRLWKKLGWTIEQTDKTISALYPSDQMPDDSDNDVNLQKLDSGFLVLLPRLGVLKRVMELLKLKPKRDLLALLACFAPIDTHGANALYREMFLSPALLELDDAFADDGFGNFLTDDTQKLLAHTEALRAAFQLSDNELTEILSALNFNEDTVLTLENISEIFRRGWLARKLKLSVLEFLMLTKFTGIDSFNAPDMGIHPDPVKPAILRLIELTQLFQTASVKPHEALYLIWNQDVSGQSTPQDGEILAFASKLRDGLTAVDSEFALADDPDGKITRERMIQVYGNQVTDLFFGLLNNTFVTEISYDHAETELDESIINTASGRIAYDDFRKTLFWSGIFDSTTRDALKTGASADFDSAIDELYAKNQNVIAPFFDSYPELKPLHDAYQASSDPIETKRSNLLKSFLPELIRNRKRQFVLQLISDEAKSDNLFAKAILENSDVLHAVGDNSKSALIDITAVENHGLSSEIFFSESIPDPKPDEADYRSDSETNLNYSSSGNNRLPLDPAATSDPVSGTWSGYIQVPENGHYNFYIEADPDAAVVLNIDGEAILLDRDGNVWSNTTAIEFIAGRLYAFSLIVENIRDKLRIRWQTFGQGRANPPARYLYSVRLIDSLRLVYIRFFKTVAMASLLKLEQNEMSWFVSHQRYEIDGEGWLNSLPITENANSAVSALLLNAFVALLHYARIKADLSSDNERLLNVFKNPLAVDKNDESELLQLTRWNADSLDELLTHFGAIDSGTPDRSTLKEVEMFCRVYDAMRWIRKLNISAATLIKATTNEPNGLIIRELQSALRARYSENDWFKILKPINDELRSLQRNALVAYILHQMKSNPDSSHIDTPEKLFEYFLMDVQMQPCMMTSRIRHALSSIQLFIERCLMNLEPEVSPDSINAKQWEWRNRYRVWEANRKVFLWPENWLEPELRDDQSPFFKETMSELLQSDITEERAAVALLNYLQKLDEVAKLEPCGLHYVENNPGTNDDIAHVVARTAGANRKYYYRRKEGSSWTPWEQIKLDIEDNPVIPVIWKGRLFLFWLRILKESKLEQPDNLPSGELNQVSASEMVNDGSGKITVKAILCWSEYFNQKWQPTRTSDIDNPLTLIPDIYPNQFARSDLKLSILEWTNGGLQVTVSDQTDGISKSFFLLS